MKNGGFLRKNNKIASVWGEINTKVTGEIKNSSYSEKNEDKPFTRYLNDFVCGINIGFLIATKVPRNSKYYLQVISAPMAPGTIN